MKEFVYYNPRRKYIDNIGKYASINESGYVCLMCPHCFNTINIEMNSSVEIIPSDIITKVNSFSVSQDIFGECPNCNEYVVFVQLDVNMGSIIEILNLKGYYTDFSCEGHVDKDVTIPYISFKSVDDMSILEFHPLPDTWYVDKEFLEEDNRFVIYDTISKTCDELETALGGYDNGVEWVRNNWNQKKRIKDIYDWAVGLPDKEKDGRK